MTSSIIFSDVTRDLEATHSHESREVFHDAETSGIPPDARCARQVPFLMPTPAMLLGFPRNCSTEHYDASAYKRAASGALAGAFENVSRRNSVGFRVYILTWPTPSATRSQQYTAAVDGSLLTGAAVILQDDPRPRTDCVASQSVSHSRRRPVSHVTFSSFPEKSLIVSAGVP